MRRVLGWGHAARDVSEVEVATAAAPVLGAARGRGDRPAGGDLPRGLTGGGPSVCLRNQGKGTSAPPSADV